MLRQQRRIGQGQCGHSHAYKSCHSHRIKFHDDHAFRYAPNHRSGRRRSRSMTGKSLRTVLQHLEASSRHRQRAHEGRHSQLFGRRSDGDWGIDHTRKTQGSVRDRTVSVAKTSRQETIHQPTISLTTLQSLTIYSQVLC